MTLLISCLAAVIATLVWYNSESARQCKISILCFLYWGASIMWLVDAVVEYLEIGAEYFTPAPSDMLNDAFLGMSVVVLALIIWVVIMLITDPKGVVRKAVLKK